MDLIQLALSPKTADAHAELFRALGNPVRLRILAYLTVRGEDSVGGISDSLDLPRNRVSRYLSGLHNAGYLNMRAHHGFHYYSASAERLRLIFSIDDTVWPISEHDPEDRVHHVGKANH